MGSGDHGGLAAIPCSGGGAKACEKVPGGVCDCGDVHSPRRGMVGDHSVSFFPFFFGRKVFWDFLTG